MRFGIVGVLATLTHVSVFAGLIEMAGVGPLQSNVIAFSLAVGVSFIGHYNWTFSVTGHPNSSRVRVYQSFAKFLAVALFGLALNSLVVLVITHVLLLSYVYAIVLMVSVVPVVLFALNKIWAFR